MDKIRNIINRLRTLWRIIENYDRKIEEHDERIAYLRGNMTALMEKINERTTVHADIHIKSPSLVIVVGEYRGQDYVRAFEVPHESLPGLIKHLKQIEPYARVGRMDMIPRFCFSAVYPHERF